MTKRLFFGLLILFCFCPETEAQVLVLEQNTEEIDAQKYLTSFLDEKAALQIKDILKPENQSRFVGNGGKVINYDLASESAVWIKLNLSLKTDKKFVADVANSIISGVDVFGIDKAGNIHKNSFDLFAGFDNREIAVNRPVLDIPPGCETIYLRLTSYGGILQTPIQIMSYEGLAEKNHRQDFFYGLYGGLVFLVVVYNLFLWITVRDEIYLHYVLYVAGMGLVNFYIFGYANEYLWPNWPAVNRYSGILYSFGSFSLLFTIRFLKTRTYSPRHHKVLLVLLAFYLVPIAGSLFGLADFSTRLIQLTALTASGVVLSAAINVYMKGYKPATFFLFAWLFFIAGVCTLILMNLQVVPHNFYTSNAMIFGSGIEIILLSLAVADRINYYKGESEKAQAETLRSTKENARLIIEQNEVLEDKVMARTQSLMEANEELNRTVEELDITNDRLAETHALLRKQHTDIHSAISYAKTIQEAILPHFADLKKSFPDSFIFFKPRDVVSGDFYWTAEKEGVKLLAAVDCTGHGVPGAFMSLVAYNSLNNIVLEKNQNSPERIIRHLHLALRQALRQKETGNRDGLDIALCAYAPAEKVLRFCGAKNPLIYFQDGQLNLVKGTRNSVGGTQIRHKRKYKNIEIDVSGPTSCFIFSDGYQDQFGGESNKKFLIKNFRNLLAEIHEKSAEEQALLLENRFVSWQKKYRQTDDILVIGFKI